MNEIQVQKQINGQPQLLKRKLRISLVIKVLTLVSLVIALVSATSNLIIYNLSFKALKDEIRNNLIMLAANAAASINVEQLAQIKSPEDEGGELYIKLQKDLQRIQNASNGKIRYLYTVTGEGEKFTYVLDATPIEDEDNHSTIGEEFVAKDYSYVKDALKKPTAEKEPTSDDVYGGIIQTGYAPIVDNSGKVIGVIGIDMDVSVLAEKEKSMRNARIHALFIAFLLAGLFGILFARYLTKPILALTRGTKIIAEGNFGAEVAIKRNDELGQLGAAFNAMSHDLKEYNEQLRMYSLELEDKVAQRTEELSYANKEIKDILDNMSQAIFTIDENLKFNKQHSRFAFNIWGDVTFAERDFLDVFFPYKEDKTNKSNMELWLRKVFDDKSSNWENLKALQPVSEVKIKIDSSDSNELAKYKYVTLDFQPIYNEGSEDLPEKLVKVMVIVQDITEKKALELEIEKKEQEYKDNINQIVEIIKADKELFEEFISESKLYLEKFGPQLIALKDDNNNRDAVDNLYRIMHNIKGNAKAFSLERIAGEAHNIESIFTAVKKGERKVTDELLSHVFGKLDKFNNLFNETLEIYNKIIHGMSVDIGKARDAKRVQEENQVLRVKVQEFNKLTKLINEAENIFNSTAQYPGTGFNTSFVESVNSAFKDTYNQLQIMRKIEIGKLFTRFPRMVRDISIELGKKINLVMSGEDVSIDKNIYDKICDPLVHIVRNSIDHGVEKVQERLEAGKPEIGTIEIMAKIDSDKLFVEVKDDGKGLDIEKIKASAVTKGFLTPEKALTLSDAEAIDLIFLPGFSTSKTISSISGRGVGMDVVKTYIENELNGKVTLKTSKGQGTSIVFEIPLT